MVGVLGRSWEAGRAVAIFDAPTVAGGSGSNVNGVLEFVFVSEVGQPYKCHDHLQT